MKTFSNICFIWAVACCYFVANGAKLPQKFHRCKVSASTDFKANRCMEEAVQHAISYLSEIGDSELGLPDLDPLRVNEIAIRQGSKDAPVAIEMIFRNIDVFGISQYKLKSVKGKMSSPKDFKFTIDGVIDSLRLIGQYSMNGKILVLPVKGSGACNLTLEGIRAGGTITGEPQIRNGKEYLKMKDFKMSLDLERTHLYFEKLFRDKNIADSMNRFLNDNWREIYSDLRPSIEKAISQLFELYTRRILERIQYKNIFILE